jgi:hypothetical protein
LDLQPMSPWDVQPGLICHLYEKVLAIGAVLGDPYPRVGCHFASFQPSRNRGGRQVPRDSLELVGRHRIPWGAGAETYSTVASLLLAGNETA